MEKESVQLTDTPGVRRKRKITDPLEQEMVKQAFNAVRDSDITLFMIDCTEGKLVDQDLKLLFYAYEEKKSIILLMNKIDLLDKEHKEILKYEMKRYEFFLKKIPIIWLSCETEKNLPRVSKDIFLARKRRIQEFDIEKVNEIIKEAIIKKPMYHKTILLKILNVKKIKTKKSIPTFILYVNFPQWFGPTQLGFIENQLRRHYNLLGCPIELIPRRV